MVGVEEKSVRVRVRVKREKVNIRVDFGVAVVGLRIMSSADRLPNLLCSYASTEYPKVLRPRMWGEVGSDPALESPGTRVGSWHE